MTRFRLIALAGAVLIAAVGGAQAQNYPNQRVTIVVPFGAGSVTDILARILAEDMGRRWNQQVIVENRPGLAGTTMVGKAANDGYTLMVGGLSNMAFNSALYSKLGYDPLKDFVPVALVYRFGYVMVARKDLPQTKLSDIVAAAKARPGSITVATAGAGTGQQLVAAAFMKAADVRLLEVPYKGWCGAEKA